MGSLRWDIFCRVVDNFGDIGVCWRLSADLAARGHRVRLWADDVRALAWMAPGAVDGAWTGVQVLSWSQATNSKLMDGIPAADVWVEAFGCDIATEFVAHRALSGKAPPVWINLEYLSAQNYVERNHALPSPVMHGPARGWTKHFFYPGFTPGSGGLLREPGLLDRLAAFSESDRKAWLARQGVNWQGERIVSLFCYGTAPLAALMQDLQQDSTPTCLLVSAGLPTQTVQALSGPTLAPDAAVQIHYLPLLTQADFDHLLWASDLNFVRGEDSLVRALWAAKPFVWHLYAQDDNAHHEKLEAFLDVLDAPPHVRKVHYAWNASRQTGDRKFQLRLSQSAPLAAWRQSVGKARERLLLQADLVSQLLRFVEKNR